MERILRRKLKGGRFSNVCPKRSSTMSRIRSKGNKSTEARLRAALIKAGVSGWKLHPPDVPGRPDFYFTKARVAVFVDGCFWHACSRCGHTPKVRSAFWKMKFSRNQLRARKVKAALKAAGVKTVRIWEHELVTLDLVLNRLSRLL
jgi:DNA mismatch endonuclease, patch repair protein